MELGRLTAVFDADHSKFDRGAKSVESRISGLSKSMQTLGATTSAIGGPLGGISGRLGSLSAISGQLTSAFSGLESGAMSAGGAMAGLAGPIGIIGAAVLAAAAGVGMLAKALFDIAVSTAEFQGKLFDLSQQTGVSVETLSALDTMAQQTGSDIGAITASLGIFQKNLEASLDPASKLSGIMGELGVETTDTEDALRQTLKALSEMKEGSHQTATALAVFGRGGKAFLAILKEMHGDLDGTIARLDEMGLITKTKAAKEADEFNDKLIILQKQVRALGATIGVEVMPAVIASINDLDAALKANKEAINALGFAAGVTAAFLSVQLKSALGIMQAALWQSMPAINAVVAGLNLIHNLSSTLGPVGGGAGGKIDVAGGIGSVPQGSGVDIGIGKGILRKKGTGGGGGGGRGGGGRPKAATEEFDEFRNLGEFYMEVAKKAHEAKVAAAELLDEILGTPITRIEAMIRLYEAAERQAEAAQAALVGPGGVDTATRDLEDFIKNTPAPEIESDVTRSLREAREHARERMMTLGQDLTSVFSRAIGDGFEQGAKRGLQSLALGLLDIVQNVFLGKMAEGLGQLLGGAGGGSGKGGFLSSIFGSIFGAIGGGGKGVGNLAGMVGHMAKGGRVPGDYKGFDSVPMMLTPGETVLPRGMSPGGQTVNNFTIQMPPQPRGSVASKRSTRQQMEQLVSMIQGSQA